MGRSQNSRTIILGKTRISQKQIFKNSELLKKELFISSNPVGLLKENILPGAHPGELSRDPIFSMFFQKEAESLAIENYNLTSIRKKYASLFLQDPNKNPHLVDTLLDFQSDTDLTLSALDSFCSKNPDKIEKIFYRPDFSKKLNKCNDKKASPIALFLSKKLIARELEKSNIFADIDQHLQGSIPSDSPFSKPIDPIEKGTIFDSILHIIQHAVVFGSGYSSSEEVARIIKEKGSALLSLRVAGFVSGVPPHNFNRLGLYQLALRSQDDPRQSALQVMTIAELEKNRQLSSGQLEAFFRDRSPGEIESLFSLIGKQAIFRKRKKATDTVVSIVGF